MWQATPAKIRAAAVEPATARMVTATSANGSMVLRVATAPTGNDLSATETGD